MPAGLLEWLRTSGARADAAAELALRVVDAIESDSELCALWDEVDGSPWHAGIADLRRRLRARKRDVSPPPRRAEVRYRLGDVAPLLTSTGKLAYIQFVGRAGAQAFDLIRVMPGLFSPPLSEGSLAILVGGESAFLSQGSFQSMLALDGSLARGHFLYPDIDQTTLADASAVPSPGELLRKIESEWRPLIPP